MLAMLFLYRSYIFRITYYNIVFSDREWFPLNTIEDMKVIFQCIIFDMLLIALVKSQIHCIYGFNGSDYPEWYPFIILMFVIKKFLKFVW